MNKVFTFVAVWPRRPRQARPSFKRGVVAAASLEEATQKVKQTPGFSGADKVEAVEFTDGVEVLVG